MRPLALAVALAVAGCTNVAPVELDVVDVGAEVTARSQVAVTVRLSATHLDGRGIAYASVYGLDFALTDGGWVLDSYRVVQ